jgi:hypothetical protein
MCIVEGCDAEAVAKGYCRRHYMRQRRHGDASAVKPAGRPAKDGLADITRQMFREWSPRTQALYTQAARRFIAIAELTGEENRMPEVIARIARPNGSFSVAKLNEISESMAAMAAARLCTEGDDDVR